MEGLKSKFLPLFKQKKGAKLFPVSNFNFPSPLFTISQTCTAGIVFYAGISSFQLVGLRLNVSSASSFTSSILGFVAVASSSALAFKSAITLKRVQENTKIPINKKKTATTTTSKEMIFHSLLGIAAFKILGGQFCNLMPSHLHYPGSNSNISIPSRGSNYANSAESAKLHNLFSRYGCHHCGQKLGKTIGDHMPPNKEAIKLQKIISNLLLSPSSPSLSPSSPFSKLIFPLPRLSKSNQQLSTSAMSSMQSLAILSLSGYASIIQNESAKQSREKSAMFNDTRTAMERFFDRFLPLSFKLDGHEIGWKIKNENDKNVVTIMQRLFPQCIECCKKQSVAVKNDRHVLVLHRPHGFPHRCYFTGLGVGGSGLIREKRNFKNSFHY